MLVELITLAVLALGAGAAEKRRRTKAAEATSAEPPAPATGDDAGGGAVGKLDIDGRGKGGARRVAPKEPKGFEGATDAAPEDVEILGRTGRPRAPSMPSFTDVGSGASEGKAIANALGGAALVAGMSAAGLAPVGGVLVKLGVNQIVGEAAQFLGLLPSGFSPQQQAYINEAGSIGERNQRILDVTGANGGKTFGHGNNEIIVGGRAGAALADAGEAFADIAADDMRERAERF